MRNERSGIRCSRCLHVLVGDDCGKWPAHARPADRASAPPDPFKIGRGTLREAGARGRSARCRLRRCVLRPARVAQGGGGRRSRRCSAIDTAGGEALEAELAGASRSAAVRRDAELWRLAPSIPRRASSRRSRARVAMLQGKRFTFDEESLALVRRRCARPRPASEFEAVLKQLEAQAAGRRAADRALRSVQAGASSFRTARVDRVFQEAIRACRERTLPYVESAADGAVHGRVRHQQVVERLQLVSGRLPEPDPGQHRPADLHRSRDRSRVPRRLSRSSRLQRAAREAPGPRSRLD